MPSSRDYLGTFATSAFIRGFTVIQGVILARMLGPVGRGELASIVLWPCVFASVGLLGINMTLARYAGQGKCTKGLARFAVRASVWTGLLFSVACWYALPYLLPTDKHDLIPAARLFVGFIVLHHLIENLRSLDQGQANYGWINAMRMLFYPAYLAGLVVVWMAAEDLVYCSVAALLIAHGLCVCALVYGRRDELRYVATAPRAREVVRASRPFGLAMVVATIYEKADIALLVCMLSPEETGFYAAALAAAGTVNILSGALGVIQFSVAAQTRDGYGHNSLAIVLRRGAILSAVGIIGLSGTLWFVLPLVYGREFEPAVSIAILLLPGCVLTGLGEVINQALRGQGRPMAVIWPRIAGLLTMALIGIPLAGIWGGRGIAIGYGGGGAVAFVGLLVASQYAYKDSNWRNLCPNLGDIAFLCSRVKGLWGRTP